ncbi:hypothetical protein EDC04DRAFT_852208 [Pisolithus marmoratus]|nr:hypothetical protein EDC04DRAFT_852208 [Pisolithus marmoratus]
MSWQIISTRQPYVSSPTSASAQAGATVLPRTANNPTIQNQNQFGYGPSRRPLRDRVSSEDNQVPQHYLGPSTSIPTILRAIVPLPTANNETFDDHASQLPLCGQESLEDNHQTPQHHLGPSTSVPTIIGAIGLPPSENRAAVYNPKQFDNYLPQPYLYGLISSEDSQILQHYTDPQMSASVPSGFIEPPQAANNPTKVQNQSNCYSHPCLHVQNGNVCEESITYGTVPEHFRAMHNIKDLPRDFVIFCAWQNCQSKVRRHNFVRHVREKHLGHERR